MSPIAHSSSAGWLKSLAVPATNTKFVPPSCRNRSSQLSRNHLLHFISIAAVCGVFFDADHEPISYPCFLQGSKRYTEIS
ncbi:hypothetical protein RB195_024367 [Necator americanus]|uniref:Uncharacterized protein n=1 Tax=Necator americanus TaxID=51031 RepID=A0ABR1EMW0_NECAM